MNSNVIGGEPGAAEIGGTVLTGNAAAPTDERAAPAIEALREELPSYVLEHGIFRRTTCWPTVWHERAVTLNELQAAAASLSDDQRSVFSFLRYHQFAKALRGPNAIEFASRQNDPTQPLYVYWRADRSGTVFQQSQQPDWAGNGISATLTAQYITDALDFAGRFYDNLALVVEVHCLIQLLAPAGTPVTAPTLQTGIYPNYIPEFRRSYRIDDLQARTEALAVEATADLMVQCGLPKIDAEKVQPFVREELERASGPRVVA